MSSNGSSEDLLAAAIWVGGPAVETVVLPVGVADVLPLPEALN